MSGQLLNTHVNAMDLEAMLNYFGTGINFFMNALAVMEGKDRASEVCVCV